MDVEVIEPHGFCHGVTQAIKLAEKALAEGPVFSLHPLVHNETVVAALAAKGMCAVAAPECLPRGSTVLFSAHGVAPVLRCAVEALDCRIIDATCPFVARIHRQAQDFARRGVPVVVVGHAGHAEVCGIVGEVDSLGGVVRVVRTVEDVDALDFPPQSAVGVLCQTTFDAGMALEIVEALSSRYANLEKPSAADVCTATRDRQDAVREFVRSGGDGVLVLGSAGSSNTMRLLEIARSMGVRFAARAESAAEAAKLDLSGVVRLGVTSGASTPESVLTDVTRSLSGGTCIAGTER